MVTFSYHIYVFKRILSNISFIGSFINEGYDKRREARHIIYFVVPMLIGNLFQQAYSMADGIIVGRYVGEHASAVGTSFPILFLMVASVLGLALGAAYYCHSFSARIT